MIGFYNYTVVLTYLGAASAILGMCSAMNGKVSWAFLFLMMSGLCDMFDGAVAKTRERTAQEKKFGIQIDSLADLICFGVLPLIIGYNLGLCDRPYQIVILMLYTIAALVRLAYFNVMEEERQAKTTDPRMYYEGLPVTSVALILPVLYSFRGFMSCDFKHVYLGALAVIACLFVSKLRIMKLKMRGMMLLLCIGLVELIWFVKVF